MISECFLGNILMLKMLKLFEVESSPKKVLHSLSLWLYCYMAHLKPV